MYFIVKAKPDMAGTTLNFALRKKTKSGEKTKSRRFVRGFVEFELLWETLKNSHPKTFIPSIPETPNTEHLNSTEYIEKKKRRLNIFLLRIQKMSEIVESQIFKDFTDYKIGEFKKTNAYENKLTGEKYGFFQKLVNVVNYSRIGANRGIYYNPQIAHIPDKEEFDNCSKEILSTESKYKVVVEALSHNIAARTGIKHSHGSIGVQLFMLSREIENSILSELIGHFGQLHTSLSARQQEQINIVANHLGDPITQIYRDCESIKSLLNYRTTNLIKFNDMDAEENRLKNKLHKIRNDPSTEMNTKVRIETVEADKKKLETEYISASQSMTKNWAKLQREKIKIITNHSTLYIKNQLATEKETLTNLENLLSEFTI